MLDKQANMTLTLTGRYGGLANRYPRGRFTTFEGVADPWEKQLINGRTDSVIRLWLRRRADPSIRSAVLWPPPLVFRGPHARESIQAHLRTVLADGSVLYELLAPRGRDASARLVTRLREATRQNGATGAVVGPEELNACEVQIRNMDHLRQVLTQWLDHDLTPTEMSVLLSLKEASMTRSALSSLLPEAADHEVQRLDAAVFRLWSRRQVTFSLERPYCGETKFHYAHQ